MTNKKAVVKNPANDSVASDAGGSLLGHLWASIAATVILGVICCGIYPLVVYGIGQAVFPVQANGSLVKSDGTYTTDDTKAVGSALIGQNFSAPQYFHPRPSAAGNGYDGTSSGGTNLGPLSDKLINGATATQPATAPSTETASSTPASAPAITETLAFDGVRLRVIHYALDNNIPFTFYHITTHKNGDLISQTPLAPADLAKLKDKEGNFIDTALVDAFPHVPPTDDPEDRTYSYVVAGDFATAIPADAVTASGSGLDPHISPDNARLQAQRVADARKLSKEKVLQLIEQYTDRPGLGIFGDPGVNVLMLNLALDRAAPVPAANPSH